MMQLKIRRRSLRKDINDLQDFSCVVSDNNFEMSKIILAILRMPRGQSSDQLH